jgi:hypothetical protein
LKLETEGLKEGGMGLLGRSRSFLLAFNWPWVLEIECVRLVKSRYIIVSETVVSGAGDWVCEIGCPK